MKYLILTLVSFAIGAFVFYDYGHDAGTEEAMAFVASKAAAEKAAADKKREALLADQDGYPDGNGPLNELVK